VRRLAALPGVTVTGAVPDVRPFLERAGVAVAPLELARGVQNKALEALAMSTPAIVSTAVSRGIDGAAGDGFLVADGPGDVAAAVLEVLGNADSASELGRRGRILVERRYSWERAVARLETLLAEASAAAGNRRSSVATA
ncbi:MAG: glycosyltransferase, partial [Candidatus Binatia bacterium]